MRLLKLLLESVSESKPITLDKEVFPQIDHLYRSYMNIMTNYKDKITAAIKDKGGKLKLGRIDIPSSYDPNFDGVDVYIGYSPTVYKNDPYREWPKGERGGYIDNFDGSNKKYILLNPWSEKNMNKKSFADLVYHELVHAVDPKMADLGDNKRGKGYSIAQIKKFELDPRFTKDKSNMFLQYLKKPFEFDAFSSSAVNNLSDSIENLDSEDSVKYVKQIIRNLINTLISMQKETPPTGDPGSDINFGSNFKSLMNIIKPLHTPGKGGEVIDYDSAEIFIYNLLFYMHKPSMFKKYIQRLSTLLQ